MKLRTLFTLAVIGLICTGLSLSLPAPSLHAQSEETVPVTASSYYNSSYSPANVLDGIIGVSARGEWASNGEQNPWIQVAWSSSQTVTAIRLYDRPNSNENANQGTLFFSDNSQINVANIPADGSGREVVFPAKQVTWVKFQITGGQGPNVGLAEIQFFGVVATASSEYNAFYQAGNVIDGIIGQSANGEWASHGEQSSRLWLTLPGPQNVNAIWIYDRPNSNDNVNSGRISFDGDRGLVVTGIPANGAVKKVIFPRRMANQIEFWASGGTGPNVGLSEFQLINAVASSEYNSSYPANNVLDDVVGQSASGEWASAGEQNPWLTILWPHSHWISSIRLADRPNTNDNANNILVTFSDNSTYWINDLPDDGQVRTVYFQPKNVTWVKFQITAGEGPNVGLSEVDFGEVNAPTVSLQGEASLP